MKLLTNILSPLHSFSFRSDLSAPCASQVIEYRKENNDGQDKESRYGS